MVLSSSAGLANARPRKQRRRPLGERRRCSALNGLLHDERETRRRGGGSGRPLQRERIVAAAGRGGGGCGRTLASAACHSHYQNRQCQGHQHAISQTTANKEAAKDSSG